MSNILFIGDIHAGHDNSLKWRLGFENMGNYMSIVDKNIRSKVTKRDITYFMGDIVLNESWAPYFKTLPGKKVLILGNHCTERVSIKTLVDTFDEVHGMMKFKEFWLSHAPIHPEELRGKVNIHGHVHSNTLNDSRYVNTSMENINYMPVSLDEIRKYLSENPGKVFTKAASK